MDYILSATIRIYTDEENESYKTEASIDVNNKADAEGLDRDIVLSLAAELDYLYSELIKKTDITQEELKEYITERESQIVINVNSIDDNIIDKLFDED